MRRHIAVPLVAASIVLAAGFSGIFMQGEAQDRPSEPECSKGAARVSFTKGGGKGWPTEDEAVNKQASRALASYDEIQTERQASMAQAGRSTARKQGRAIASFVVREFPDGGYGVTGATICVEDMKSGF